MHRFPKFPSFCMVLYLEEYFSSSLVDECVRAHIVVPVYLFGKNALGVSIGSGGRHSSRTTPRASSFGFSERTRSTPPSLGLLAAIFAVLTSSHPRPPGVG